MTTKMFDVWNTCNDFRIFDLFTGWENYKITKKKLFCTYMAIQYDCEESSLWQIWKMRTNLIIFFFCCFQSKSRKLTMTETTTTSAVKMIFSLIRIGGSQRNHTAVDHSSYSVSCLFFKFVIYWTLTSHGIDLTYELLIFLYPTTLIFLIKYLF